MTSGSPTERKAAIEALIAEVQITDTGVIPVFKIPTGETTMPPPNPDEGINTEDGSPVRTMVRSVDRRFQHTNRYATAVTCSFLLPLARERRSPDLPAANKRPFEDVPRPLLPLACGAPIRIAGRGPEHPVRVLAARFCQV